MISVSSSSLDDLGAEDGGAGGVGPASGETGSVVAIPDVSSAIVSTLRDKLIAQLGSKVPVNRIKLSMGHVTLTNSESLASYNIMDGEEIAFELRDPKK
ncbi:hypothetical protein PIIN_03791 [Serendipita indica DSM 11827]|uniref:Ubiquitin-like domain-containing protein n=1 Tax=Serendipita indica (strain DSM 11827) TaxID=1109443 RepID=G4TET6_SERID|nr:hypothetical protein PIIN_03791 [Serendipita indica DSM 11827]